MELRESFQNGNLFFFFFSSIRVLRLWGYTIRQGNEFLDRPVQFYHSQVTENWIGW